MTAKKVMVIGLDAPIVSELLRHVQEGQMPTVKRLLDNGVYGKNCYPNFPSITPPNWATLATGATMASHQVTDFSVHRPGADLDQITEAFDSSFQQAEFIWEAAEKVGKKAIVVNYPTAWPPRMKEGITIAGLGTFPNAWHLKVPMGAGPSSEVSLAEDQLWSTEAKPQATTIQLSAAQGWTGAPAARRSVEVSLPLSYRKAMYELAPLSWRMLALDDGEGFYRVIVAESKDAAQPLADLRVGQWSETIVREFQTSAGPQRAGFRLKLLSLAPDGTRLALFCTALCALDGWDFPAGLSAELPLQGLPLPQPGFQSLRLGWIDVDTLNEMVEMVHEWFGEVSYYLTTTKEWDIYYTHIHTTDSAYHVYSNIVDPQLTPSPERYQLFSKAERFMYESLDRLITRLLVGVDEDETAILVVSDHGAKPTGKIIRIGDVLRAAGLLTFQSITSHQQPAGVDTVTPETPRWESQGLRGKFSEFGPIDWSATKAIPQRSCYVYVNLKGRDPQGCVEPADYEQVRDEVIRALYDYTDPETGVKPVVFALRREDARYLQMAGEGVGDVVYTTAGNYHGQHGGQLGSAKFGGIGDLRTLFILSGPGVKKGQTIERTIWLEDIVPTLCYLADLPVPEQCEGGVIYQALEDPNMGLNRYQSLHRRYEKMRKSLDRAPMC